MTSKFRTPTNNVRYTSQLFWDMWIELPHDRRTCQPMFTLHEDKEGLINFRKEYVRDMDPTGYTTATRLLENFDHWGRLMGTKWFKEAKKEWDKELAAKMDAEATAVLQKILKGGDEIKTSEQIAAAKVMLGKAKTVGKKPVVSVGRGRPSKEEVEGELKNQARLTKEEQDDLDRIRKIR